MPIYTFRDTDTDEVFDIMMSMNDLDAYKVQNPTHARVLSAPAIVSGVSLTGKLDDGFKDVISKISSAHPDSPLAQQHGRKSIKQAQTERALKKWRGSESL